LLRFTYKILLVILTVALFSSCAIHAGFPFICFKKDCIKGAWSLPRKEAGGKRGLGQRMSIAMAKISAKKRKNANKSIDVAKIKVDHNLLDALLSDTTQADKFIKVAFHHKGKTKIKTIEVDSLYIKSSFLTLSKNDRILINYYLNKYEVKNITDVYISFVIVGDEKEEQVTRVAIMKMKKVEHYLIKTKVKKSRIKIIKK